MTLTGFANILPGSIWNGDRFELWGAAKIQHWQLRRMLEGGGMTAGRVKCWRAAMILVATLLSVVSAYGDTIESGETRQWCVGRLLVSLPENFRAVSASGNIRGVEIEFQQGISPERAMAERRQQLQSGRAKIDGTPVKLLDVVNQADRTILSYAQDFSELGDVTTGDWYEEVFVAAGGGTFRLVQFMPADLHGRRRDELLSVASAIQPWTGERPRQPGACIGQAFIALPPGDEAVTMNFATTQDEGPAYQIDYLHRLPGERPLDFDGLSVPGTQSVEIAGLSGQEQVSPDAPGEFFMIAGRPGSAREAGIRLRAEFIDDGTMPFDRAKAIWDAVLLSMRLTL